MKYLIKLDSLKDKNENFKIKLKKIDECLLELELIKNNCLWTGQGAKTFFDNYDKYYQEVKDIQMEVMTMINYFNKYYNLYDEEFNHTNQKFVNDMEDSNHGENS